eukprot:1270910-Amorphochlora_amoeboformis.AAC.2
MTLFGGVYWVDFQAIGILISNGHRAVERSYICGQARVRQCACSCGCGYSIDSAESIKGLQKVVDH